MILPNSYGEWGGIARFFCQPNVDDAIATFKTIENTTADDLKKARAMAWRSYCTINAVLEGWQIKDWGSGEDASPDLLEDAYDLADAARALLGDEDFDVLWAVAYAQMAKLEAEAGDTIRKAIAICRLRRDEGDSYALQSMSSLLAEAADIFIYQGELDGADAAIHEGLYLTTLSGRKGGVDWHHWVRALVLFNKALLAEDSADVFTRDNAPNAYKEVARILKQDLSKPDVHRDYEFDSYRVHAAAHWKLGEHSDKTKQLNKYKDKLLNRKAPWTAAKEKFRSRYLSTGVAGTLKAKWSEVADALFPV